MFSRILVCSDGSDSALKAAHVAAELAKKFDSQVTILNVFTVQMPIIPFAGVPGLDTDMAMMHQYAEEVQNAVARRTGRVLEEAGIEYNTRLELGYPAEVILRVAQEEKSDLIVLGSRGLSEFKSFFLGSVSDRVSHHAHCAVMIVK